MRRNVWWSSRLLPAFTPVPSDQPNLLRVCTSAMESRTDASSSLGEHLQGERASSYCHAPACPEIMDEWRRTPVQIGGPGGAAPAPVEDPVVEVEAWWQGGGMEEGEGGGRPSVG